MTRRPNILKRLLRTLALLASAVAVSTRADASRALGEAVSEDGRTYRDFVLAADRPAGEAAALRVRLASPLPREKVRAVTLHLRAGEGWHTADVGSSTDAFCSGSLVRIPLSAFAPEGSPAPIAEADAIRVSAWKNAAFDEPVELAEAAFDTPARIAVVRSTERTAPGDTALAGLLATRCAGLLDKAGLAYDFVSDDFAALAGKRVGKATRAYDLVLLPFSPRLTSDENGRLRAFVKAGGKLVVFFNADRTLGALLGVDPGPWRSTGSRAYTAIDAAPLLGAARRIPHVTSGVIPPRPVPEGKARQAATWLAANNRPVAGPAVTVSPEGAWFAHIPPRAFPAAVDLVHAIATNLVPSLANAQSTSAREVLSSKLKVQSSTNQLSTFNFHLSTCLKGKTCAAWANSAELPVESLGRLGDLGLDTLFLRWQGGRELKPLFPGGEGAKRGGIKGLVEEGHAAGIKIHVWMPCFQLDGVSNEERAKLASGKQLDPANPLWLNPTLPKNHDFVVARLVEMAKQGVDGIHIDYARTDDATPPSPATTAALTAFVRKASKAVRAANADLVFSAAVFPTPESAALRNQDWPAWVREGLVDYVCPMIYTESPAAFRAQLAACAAAAPADRILPGIGTGADESQTDAPTTAEEVSEAVRAGCRGAAFFTLDDSLLEILEAFR